MFFSMSHWTGLRLLPSAALSILNSHQHSSQNPVILCPGDPVALLLQVWSLHLLQQFLDRVDVGVNQLKALYLSLDGTWISPTVLPHCPSEAKGHLSITHILASRQGLGQLSHRPRSIVLAAQVMCCALSSKCWSHQEAGYFTPFHTFWNNVPILSR